MLHLPTERLAALADDDPTVNEAEHLASCDACATTLAAQRRLLAVAGEERHRIAPALTDWSSLSSALRAEGLIAPATGRSPAIAADSREILPIASRGSMRWVARIAAALTLTTTGILAGRASAGAPLVPRSIARGAETPVVSVSDTTAGFGSTGEALATLTSAQHEYHRAAAYLAAHDTSSQGEGASTRYRTRLAALDQLAETSREALNTAPADPVLNQYYLSTLSAREATIRQIGTALPVGTRLTRF